MRRISTLVAAAAVLTLTACGGDSETETMETMPAEQTAEPMPESNMPTTPATGSLMDANSATQEDLVTAGVDSATAAMIVDDRPFNGILALDEVLSGSGMSDADREAVYRTVWIPIDLNTASQEEILLIPGMGERMLHEFEEYRPYRGMEEFRREIGKYVDENEVARLEQYVTLEQ